MTDTLDALVKRLNVIGALYASEPPDLSLGLMTEAARALEALQVENGRLKAERIDAYEKALKMMTDRSANALHGLLSTLQCRDLMREQRRGEIPNVESLSHPSPAPDGWQCVPKRPTPEMFQAYGKAANADWSYPHFLQEPAWNAMLAAAPPAPSQGTQDNGLTDRSTAPSPIEQERDEVQGLARVIAEATCRVQGVDFSANGIDDCDVAAAEAVLCHLRAQRSTSDVSEPVTPESSSPEALSDGGE